MFGGRRSNGEIGARIGEGARVTSPRREIRRMSPKRAHTVALRCPDDCVKRAHVRISRGSPENAVDRCLLAGGSSLERTSLRWVEAVIGTFRNLCESFC